jgi:hypothetical protein
VRHSDVVYNLVGREYPTKFVLLQPIYCGDRMLSRIIGTSPMKMYTLMAQNELLRQWRNMI